MARWNIGTKNGMWRNGRSVASNGYVLVRVGVDHHLADVRGYAYEHRVVAETKLGRRLRRGEVVHHLDGNKENNSAGNLEVLTHAWHHVKHRKPGGRRRLPGERNPLILCGCGCLVTFRLYDRFGRPRRFVSGHNGRM